METLEVIRPEPMTPSQLLAMAVDKDLDIEKLSKLMDLQKSWQSDQARKAFYSALSEFQDNCPDIRKTKKVGFETKQGRTDYNYAPLADIDRQIKKTMKLHGLTKRWEIQDSKEEIKVTCIVTHIDGHSEQTTMQSNPDVTGSKNPIQARGSAIEYMKRYTLIGALGITTADQDIDGRMPEPDIDKLHKEYMDVYGQVIQLDSTLSRYHVDDWKVPPTPKAYVSAIGELRKVLFNLQNKK